MKHLILPVFLLYIFPGINSQEPFRFFEAEGHYGFIIPHAMEIEPVSNTNPAGFQVAYHRLNTSFDSWSIFNTFWSSGIKAAVFIYDNPRILGNAAYKMNL